MAGLGFGAEGGGALGPEVQALKDVLAKMILDHERKADARKKNKKKGKEHDRRRRRSRSASKSSSSSSTSSSSSSTSQRRPNNKYMQWTPKGGKKRKIGADLIMRAEAFRMKKRSDLLSFSSRYPGGLAALLLYQVRRRTHGSAPEDSDQLRAVDPTAWTSTGAEMKDIRDQKELHFLSQILGQMSSGKYEQVADLVAQRVREVRSAKAAGGSWDKAAAVSLMPQPLPGNTPLPDGAFVL